LKDDKHLTMFQRIFTFSCLLFISQVAFSQYTETINSNRPGASQGAFSVGRNIFQIEAGASIGSDDHELLNYESDNFGVESFLRYGAFLEQLEFSLAADFLAENRLFTTGAKREFQRANLDRFTLGAKYLVYDPYKNGPDKPNIYSWKANHRFKWKSLIPAVSIYAGANFKLFKDNPFVATTDGSVTPRVELITQNNWSGGWVFVTNLIANRIGEDLPSYAGIFTLTHSFNSKVAGFLEYQVIKDDVYKGENYSDNIARGGAAYLIIKDLQIDISGLINFKDTPSRFQVALGASYRIDSRTENDDVILDDLEGKGARKSKNQKRK